jgi:hypothetical protein
MRDSAACDKISDATKKESCRSQVAFKLDNKDECKKITEVSSQTNCLLDIALETGKSEPCLEIVGLNEKESCLHSLAKQEHNLYVCELIETEEWRDKCVDEVYANCSVARAMDPEKVPYHCQGGQPPSHEEGPTAPPQ